MSDENEAALKRILDANRNRALEALRVLEDHLRFVRQASALATRAKDLRHRVHLALARPAFADLVAHRDVAGDPGRPGESTGAAGTSPTGAGPGAPAPGPRAVRGSTEDVALASFGRAKEALRALEEYAKPLDRDAAAELERVRYATYELEASHAQAVSGAARLAGKPLYVLLEEKAGRPPLGEQARAALAGGARLFQLREKKKDDGARLADAREIARIVQGEGGLLLVNDRPDVAVLAGADGVHVGQTDLPPGEVRRLLSRGSLVGSSAHDAPELARSLAGGPDYMGIGTVFASPTKPELGVKGLEVLRSLARAAGVPVYAIGGVTLANAASAIDAGASGVAVSSAVLDASSIADAVRALDGVVREALARRRA